MIEIRLSEGPFEPYAELERFEAELRREQRGKFGATASFVGTMRDYNEGDEVRSMVLEHYPGMTERQLHAIADAARQQFAVVAMLIIHRVGPIQPNDSIVLVGVWAGHRGPAFDACRTVLEALKHQAPFWKKEVLADRERWVERNTDGH